MSRYRHEYKYYLDAMQENILLIRAQGMMQRDKHAGENGFYWIRSLYFDDFDNTCFYENVNGTDRRSKFRIRYYNNNTSYIMLEKKSKVKGMTRKESCRLDVEECRMLMKGEIPEVALDFDDMKRKLFLEMQLRGLQPKVIVTYKRIPFVYSVGNVRVTFDQNISSSVEITKFLDGNYVERPILACGGSILEVKWDELLPLHIRDYMKIDGLQWTNFSKYYMCRKYHL